MSEATQREMLYNIAVKSQRMWRSLPLNCPCSRRPTPPHISPATSTITPFILPPPEPLTSVLLDAGLRRHMAERVSDAFMRAGMQLKARYEMQYTRINVARIHTACDAQILGYGTVSPALKPSLTAKYQEILASWKAILLDQIAEGAQVGEDTVSPPSRRSAPQDTMETIQSVNQAAVPVLEECFAHNTSPSSPEEEQLATKTGLDLKQVQIWAPFQNCRRRTQSRGEVKPARHREQALPLDLHRSVDAILCESSMHGDYVHKSFEIAEMTCILNPLAPPHAFPSAYPPQCDYTPFPLEGERPVRHMPWPRSSSQSRVVSSPIDVTELANMLSKLNIDDVTNSDSSVCHNTNQGFHSRTLPAPLPALVRYATPDRCLLVGKTGDCERPWQCHIRAPRRAAREPVACRLREVTPSLLNRQTTQRIAQTSDSATKPGSAWGGRASPRSSKKSRLIPQCQPVEQQLQRTSLILGDSAQLEWESASNSEGSGSPDPHIPSPLTPHTHSLATPPSERSTVTISSADSAISRTTVAPPYKPVPQHIPLFTDAQLLTRSANNSKCSSGFVSTYNVFSHSSHCRPCPVVL